MDKFIYDETVWFVTREGSECEGQIEKEESIDGEQCYPYHENIEYPSPLRKRAALAAIHGSKILGYPISPQVGR